MPRTTLTFDAWLADVLKNPEACVLHLKEALQREEGDTDELHHALLANALVCIGKAQGVDLKTMAAPSTIYMVVYHHGTEEDHIQGFFSSEQKAKDFLAHDARPLLVGESSEIVDYQLDEACEF